MPFVDMFIDEPAASKVNRDMSTPIVWRGVFPASTTQLNEDQSLNLDATGVHLQSLIKSGGNGVGVRCGWFGFGGVEGSAGGALPAWHRWFSAHDIPLLVDLAGNSQLASDTPAAGTSLFVPALRRVCARLANFGSS